MKQTIKITNIANLQSIQLATSNLVNWQTLSNSFFSYFFSCARLNEAGRRIRESP